MKCQEGTCDICRRKRKGVLDGGTFQCDLCNPSLMSFYLAELERVRYERSIKWSEDNLPMSE